VNAILYPPISLAAVLRRYGVFYGLCFALLRAVLRAGSIVNPFLLQRTFKYVKFHLQKRKK